MLAIRELNEHKIKWEEDKVGIGDRDTRVGRESS